MAKKTKKAAPQSRETASIKSFLDMIAPSVVKFEPDHFICGNTFRCVWALREYPTQTDEQAILRHLGEKDGITLRIYTRQVTPAEEKRIIQNAANKNRMGQLQHQRPAADDHGGKQSAGCGVVGSFHAPQPRAAAPLRRLYRADRFGL